MNNLAELTSQKIRISFTKFILKGKLQKTGCDVIGGESNFG